MLLYLSIDIVWIQVRGESNYLSYDVKIKTETHEMPDLHRKPKVLQGCLQ